MNKTIEERAIDTFSMPEQPCLEAGIRDVMIKFAKEQQKIDIEKACEWLSNFFNGETRCVNQRTIIEQFTQAMEEK